MKSFYVVVEQLQQSTLRVKASNEDDAKAIALYNSEMGEELKVEEKVVSRISTSLIGFLDDPRNEKIITLIMNI